MKSQLPFIPFVRGVSDVDHLNSFYSDAPLCRVSLEKPKSALALAGKYPLWIDIGFDGAPAAFTLKPVADWKAYITQYGDLSCIVDPNFTKRPTKDKLQGAIDHFLDAAWALRPYMISVPQLAQEDGTGTNKINRLLAEITSEWRKRRGATARLVLPVVFTNQRQLNKKTDRNLKVALIKNIVDREGIDSVWATDSTLEDQSGTGNFDKERFPGVIDFFRELNAACTLSTVITGPFWGLGLLLWSRKLVTHFGVGLGATYRYHVPGGMAHNAKARIAVGCLRRWVASSVDLQQWLKEGQRILAPNSPEHAELQMLERHLTALLNADTAKRQVARAYRQWIDKIAAMPAPSRAVGLFQDLSAAFVTGKALPDIPGESGLARRPERVAEQLMVNCL